MLEENKVLYEFPCNEKIRTYLRLENLFSRFDWFCQQTSPIPHLSAIGALFDLTDATARSDLRNELIQALDRRRQGIATDSDDYQKLSNLISRISRIVGKSGQRIRENEWLQLIRTRQALAGGTCEFDLPVLHHWLSRPARIRQAELRAWSEAFLPTRDAIQIVLSDLRASYQDEQLQTSEGSLQYSLHGRSPLLARIALPAGTPVIPAMSANKYMLWLRFSTQDENYKLHPYKELVSFTLSLCSN